MITIYRTGEEAELEDFVKFDDGKGNELDGTVFRIWDRAKLPTVSVRTCEEQRTFVRLASHVKLSHRGR